MKKDIEREIKAKRIRGSGIFKVDGDPPTVGNVELDLIWGISDKD